MNTNNEFTPVMIKCPACDTVQAAIVEHTIPFGTYIHHCEKCKYIIMESEWDTVKPFSSETAIASPGEGAVIVEPAEKSKCFEFPAFGASYPDAQCSGGYLWDLDSVEDGHFTSGGDIPCPVCNHDAYIEYLTGYRPGDPEYADEQKGIIEHMKFIYQKYGKMEYVPPSPAPPSVEPAREKTVGQIITEAINLHELVPETVESVLDFPKGYIRKIMNNEVYMNSIPVVLFKNLLVSLHIRFWEIAPAFIPTYKLLKSKETEEDLKKKPHGYMLWENEESLYKYASHLNELMEPTQLPDSQLHLSSRGIVADGQEALMEELRKSEIN